MHIKSVRCGRCRKYLPCGPSPLGFSPAPTVLRCAGCGVDNAARGGVYRFSYYFRYTLRLWVFGALFFTLFGTFQIGSFDLFGVGYSVLFFGVVVGFLPSLALALPVGLLVEWIAARSTGGHPSALPSRARSDKNEFPLSALLGQTLDEETRRVKRARKRSA